MTETSERALLIALPDLNRGPRLGRVQLTGIGLDGKPQSEAFDLYQSGGQSKLSYRKFALEFKDDA